MFQQLQYFIAVVETGNFTLAAERSNISQSAISQQLKRLEEQLGVELIKREGRSFTVTLAGQYFYTHGKDLIREVDALVTRTQQVAKPNEAVLRVGYLQNFGSSAFLRAVSQFVKEYPQVDLKIYHGTHEHLYELLRDDKIDLAFNDQRRALSDDFINEKLVTTEMVVAIGLTALPQNINQVEISDLKDLKNVLVIDESQRDTEEVYYREILGVQSPFEVVGSHDEAEMVLAANRGYMLVSAKNQQAFNSDVTRLLKVTLNGRPIMQNYYAFWKNDNSGYFVETFAGLLKEQF
ncbi:LysR family transcriptional regulator [Weissella cibaria]|uniref:LysR family transcriptional regulator n=1 Tax=Weissella cibaria TaxID=137591 RepID=UPI001C1F61C8|nr:LysR family transcriptional regulator [Weissella cibaria]MBU7561576.1 LysR family transcriptional regulator [Weissella cibaria]